MEKELTTILCQLFKKCDKLYSQYDRLSIQLIDDNVWLIGHESVPYEKDSEISLCKIEDLNGLLRN